MLKEKLAELVVEEVESRAKNIAWKYKLDQEELTSFLIAEVWNEVNRKESMANVRGIRHIIKLRTVDFIREIARFNHELSFDLFNRDKKVNEYYDNNNFEQWYYKKPNKPEQDSAIMLEDFVKTLTNKQAKILSMKVSGYSVNEISEYLEIHRNTVRNILNQIKEQALDFGLEGI